MKKKLPLVLISFLLISCAIFSLNSDNESEFHFFLWNEVGRGIIDCDGNWIIAPESDLNISNVMVDGYAPVMEFEPDRMYFVDQDGEAAFGKTFEAVHSFRDGYAAVKEDGKWGFINTDGNFVIQPKYETNQIGDFGDGLADVPAGSDANGNPQTIFIDTDGKKALGPYYWASSFTNGYAAVSEAGEDYSDSISGYIDTEGNYLIKFDFESKLNPIKYSAGEGLFGAADLDKEIISGECSIGYMNAEMEWIIEPQFCDATAFQNGLAAVSLRNEDGNFDWGYIDKEGSFVIEPKYGFATAFEDSCAVVLWDNFSSIGLINTEGEIIQSYTP